MDIVKSTSKEKQKEMSEETEELGEGQTVHEEKFRDRGVSLDLDMGVKRMAFWIMESERNERYQKLLV